MTSQQPKRRIEVTGAVFLRDGRILAARRGESKSLEGKWEFPGGKIEAGESPQAALARELQEELLVEATVGKPVTTTEHEYDFGTVVLSTFFCSLRGAEPQLTEHSEIKWVLPEELHTLDWAPADLPTVEILSTSTL